ncbi:VCBS repeat-containing protein [Streptomyces sp. NBC_01142]|uniref:VCBS repeat-containing protein n=1 Tax=Streptomyces sp. NBC_01142 TaxID=2975865 RepID=UPI00225C2DC2|nr:VCBS repeat-containing protein [Streptomyces sp. NBC_01142]MCX4823672.1 VCBS repeat-containing protein [Streptomyces sp. NBC_01142]
MRFRPARRIAACTALALSAGMLLALPAHADDAPAPRAPVEQVTPGSGQQPKLTFPPRSGGNGGKKRSEAIGAADVSPAMPRSDVDGDGFSELFYRAPNGKTYVAPSSGADTYEYRFNAGIHESPNETYKDVFSIAGLEESGPVHFTLGASGRLSAYRSSADQGDIIWSGTGWQQFNKVFSPGDLTGDGVGDVLARTNAGDLYLYRATPGAASPFAGKVRIGGGWQQFDQLVGVNDVNSDGVADLFARNPAGTLYFYSGTGDVARPFKDKVALGTGWQQYNQLFGLDDINGDGLSELIARNTAGVLYSYSSTGTGTFLPRAEFGSGWNVAVQFGGAGNNPTWGKSELLGLDTKGTLYSYYSLNNGQLSARERISDVGGWKGAKPTLVSSLDNNGFSDLLEVYNNTLFNYSHTSGQVQTIGTGWGVYNTLVGPGDLSGDGKGDLLARDGSGALYLYRGNGTGTAFATKVRIGGGWQQFNKLAGAGDLTGDGRADLLARAKDGKLYLYPGTGVATAPFAAKKLIGGGWQQFTQLAAPGDLTGDGRGDLLARTSAGELFRYDANGAGGFKAKAKIGTGWNTYSSLH